MVWLITDSLIGRPLLFTEKESELANHGRSCDQIDGWVGPNSEPNDYKRTLWSRPLCDGSKTER